MSALETSPYCLIVDDEPRLRQVMAHLMRGDGFQCVEAANGIEALEQLEKYPFVLALSDLRMPKMDGLELLREIRARHPDYDDERLRLAYARLVLGDDLARRVWPRHDLVEP